MVEASLVNLAELVVLIVGVALALLQIRDMTKTRTAELYLRLWERWNTAEFTQQRYECYRMEWINSNDFDMKYNVRENPEVFTSWNTFGRNISGLAELENKNLIDIEFLDLPMLPDIVGWWSRYGEMLLRRWEGGRYTWHSHFPFLEEVVGVDRVKRPWMYDSVTGEYLNPHSEQRWVNPKKMTQIRARIEAKNK